jgi:DNA polymerase-1
LNVLIADTETNGFLPLPPQKDGPVMDRIWTIQIGTPESEEVTVYADQPGFPPLAEAVERLKVADRVVIHNGVRFDIHAINLIFPGTLRPEQIYDSLVVARLLNPNEKKNTLKDWGERLGVAKGDYGGDFSRFDQELVKYARQDIVVGRALYLHQQKIMAGWNWDFAVWLECLYAYVLSLQEQNGFELDVQQAIALAAELRQEKHDVTKQLQEIFQPIVHERYSEKTGKRLKDYVEVFNPGSGQQVARRLIDKYGWKPRKFTNTGIPATDEKVLAGLPYPEAKLLLQYNRLEKRLGQIEDGKNGWLKLVDEKTSRVHGAVNTIGAVTGRCSHFKPNMAQVDKKDLRMRQVWKARKGWKLVGVDAAGLEFRILAHYIAPSDGGLTIERVLNGKKEDGTDIHTANLKAAGMYDRDKGSKRALYAMIYGGRDPKLGEIAVADAHEAKMPRPKGSLKEIGARVRAAIGKATPGIDKLIDAISAKAKRQKFIKGIDGRKIFIRSPHSATNFLFQGGGAIVMKLAKVIFHFERLPKLGLIHGVDFAYCADVHDEVQIESKPEFAELIGKTFADCIREAGERLGVRCPLAGDFSIGENWRETH